MNPRFRVSSVFSLVTVGGVEGEFGEQEDVSDRPGSRPGFVGCSQLRQALRLVRQASPIIDVGLAVTG
ncbi:hypothetical protein FHX49_000495 [Microbacterium endophyticum]|uniref:Uncharacterized protein n=1 Tax=Microbacterium endophyticum TaxID=1526412 RepID=A0A7W4V1B7_9MICO|nr:hypothetical protein [Microbacterium endophyticum]NIK37251.1 hypothetical protein [Microbacterium endophyticum]